MHLTLFQMLLTVLKVITVYLHRSLKKRFLEGVARTAHSFFENDDFYYEKLRVFEKQWKRRFFLEALGPCVLCHRMHPHEIARLHVQRRVANLRRMY